MDTMTNRSVENISDEVSLKNIFIKTSALFKYILSKWIIILIVSAVGAVLGLAYAFQKKAVYKAELRFALQDENSNNGMSGALGLASQFGLNIGSNAGGEFSGDNLLELLRSRSVIERALLSGVNVNGKSWSLAEQYITINDLRKTWANAPDLKNMYFAANADRSKYSRKQDSVLGVFYKDLSLNNVIIEKTDKALNIISIKDRSRDELFSKNLADALAKVISDFYVQTKTGKAKKNVDVLQKQVDSVRRVLYSGISGVAESADAAPNANPALQTLRVPSQRRQVEVQVNGTILSELVKNLEIAKMSLLQETPLIQVIDRPILPLDEERPGKVKSIVIGAFIAFLLTVVALILSKLFKRIMA